VSSEVRKEERRRREKGTYGRNEIAVLVKVFFGKLGLSQGFRVEPSPELHVELQLMGVIPSRKENFP
jgi:hypothetical protein